MKNNIGIYIHTPFCDKKCPYCNFYSINFDRYEVDKYINRVCDVIKMWSKVLNNKFVDTVYFGGGTPNLIGHDNIIKIINSVKETFECYLSEVSVEINPCSYKFLDFELLNSKGVNRVSIGAQSVNDEELSLLGRNHTCLDIKNCLSKVRASRIDNVSIDLMLGVQKQNLKSIDQSLNFCIENKIDHISAYILKIEEGTTYYKNKNSLILPTEYEEADMYFHTAKTLKSAVYFQYEISNFCFNDKKCIHNLKYWNLDEYLGIGPSAHSFVEGKRFYYESSVKSFLESSQVLPEPCENLEQEYIMLRLRLGDGINYKDFEKKFGYVFPKDYIRRAKKYLNTEFLVLDKIGIRLTTKGFLVSNKIISDIIY